MDQHMQRRGWEAAAAGQGPVAALEALVRESLGVDFAVAVSSGTAALHAALWAGGVEPGDEVVCPALDWYAAAAVTLHLGAVPVFADIDPATYTVTRETVGERVSPRTRALVATDLFGHPAQMEGLRFLAEERGLLLVEDAAQALGASERGRPAGTRGHVGCLSLGIGKAVEVGDGGLVITDNERIWEHVISFCQHPLRQRWEGITPYNPFSLNYRIAPHTAEAACVAWERLPTRCAEQQGRLHRVNVALAGSVLAHPVAIRPTCTHAAYRLCARLHPGVTRDVAAEALRDEGLIVSGCPAPYLPQELESALTSGVWHRHPALKRLQETAGWRCPVADAAFQGKLVCLEPVPSP